MIETPNLTVPPAEDDIWVGQVRFAIEGVAQGIVGLIGLVGKCCISLEIAFAA